ncbi:MAG TPA: hypothetical protein H9969_06195 [Candidatus Barnesiella merdipullorum]|nr:hypothetical protein [Candidatus Barnesiella merdipullorum]
MFNFFHKKPAPEPLFPYTTEVHCHILPGIDDGSPDVEHSLPLLRQLRQWGIEKVIATPHVTEATFENTPQTVGDAYERLCREPEFGETGIQLCYSAEYRMDDNFLGIFQRNEIMPMPGNHVLIENSFLQPFWNIKELVFELQLKGFSPILAHPERYAYYYDDKKIYQELHNQGCEFQVNLLSLAGYYNRRSREVAEWLASQHMIDYLGSDLHNSNHLLHLSNYLTGKDFAKHMREIHPQNDSL